MISAANIRSLVDDISRQFKPDKIILFGSYARGSATKDSDIDLLVVMPYKGRESDLALKILTFANPRFAVDLLVRTPRDIARRYRQFDPVARDAIDNGVVLYAKRNSGMARKSGARFQRRLHPIPVS